MRGEYHIMIDIPCDALLMSIVRPSLPGLRDSGHRMTPLGALSVCEAYDAGDASLFADSFFCP
jgi:hypothetical protein